MKLIWLIFLGIGMIFLSITTIDFSGLFYFVNIPAILFVLLGTIFFTLSTFSVRELFQAIRYIFVKQVDREKLKLGISVLQTIRSYSTALGLLGMVLGVILMLRRLEDPRMILIAISIYLLPMFYGLLGNLICFSGIKFVERKLEEQKV